MPVLSRPTLAACSLALAAGLCAAAPPASPPPLPVDPVALNHLVSAVSLDVMSEASVDACEDVGASAFEALRAAWATWRERHQLAPMRQAIKAVNKRTRRKESSWDEIIDPIRQRVLDEPAPDAACAALARDYQAATMDATALYPRAGEAVAAIVKAGFASIESLPVVDKPPRGKFIVPAQVRDFQGQVGASWNSISWKEAEKRLGPVYVKGRVKRGDSKVLPYLLVQEHGDRVIGTNVYLTDDVEALVGREVVLRALLTSLNWYSIILADVAVVADTSGLTPSPLPSASWSRKPVLLRRVLSPSGKGVADKDIAAVVLHGKPASIDGTGWIEDVRFLLRDGTVYDRTSMPPDELNVAASRQLEPQQWGRWRKSNAGYETQGNDADGKPDGDWKRMEHHPVRAWPQDTRLEGRYTYGSFSGSLMLGGVSSKQTFYFSRDGRFDTSYSSFAGSGSMAATNGAAISSSYHADSRGTVSAAGGTVAGVGATTTSRTQEEGADRRGRYRLSGYALVLDFDNGRQRRLLSFPSRSQDDKAIFIDGMSYMREK